MAQQLTNLAVDVVSFVKRAAVRDPTEQSQPRRFVLYKSERSEPPPTNAEGGDEMTDADKAALAKAEADRDAAEAEVAKLQARGSASHENDPADMPKNEHDGDDMHDKKPGGGKSVTGTEGEQGEPRKSEDLSKADERVAKAEQRAEAAENIAKKERELRIEGEFVAKAEEDFKALSVDPKSLGPVLMRAQDALSKEDYEVLESVLKGAEEAVYQGELFKEAGKGGIRDNDTASDAYGKLQKAAEEIKKSDSSVSMGDAMAQAMRENPELERQYMTEARGGIR